MSKTITIAGQKGGIGKSTAAVNLAASLALLEKRTLLVDCDPRGCSTQWSSLPAGDLQADLSQVLSGRSNMTRAIVSTRIAGLDVLPGNLSLYHSAARLSRNRGNEKILRLFLKDVQENYDYIIVDSPSSYHFMSTAAMIAADTLLVMVSVNGNTGEDFNCLLRMVKHVRSAHDVPVTLGGLVFNQCPGKVSGLAFLEEQGLSEISQMVYETVIPEDRNVRDACAGGVPVLLLDLKSPASIAFLALANEMDSAFNKRGAA